MELVLSSIAIGMFFTNFGRRALKALHLYLVIMFPKRPIHLPNFIQAIKREEIVINKNGLIYKPDVYRPLTNRKLPTIIIHCPLATEGKDDKHIVNFMKGMARLGYVVVAPYWPARMPGEIHDNDTNELKATIDYLVRKPYVDKNKISVAGISYGIGPTLVTASDPKYKKLIKSIVSIGGYANFRNVYHFIISSGEIRQKNKILKITLDPYGMYVLIRSLSKCVNNENDKRIINKFLEKVLYKRQINTENLIEELSPASKKIFRSTLNRGKRSASVLPKKFNQIIDNLSVIDLARKLKKPLLIFHSTSDAIVPYTESVALYQATKDYGSKLFLVDAFEHTIPKKATIRNLIKLYLPNLMRVVRFIDDVIKTTS